MHIMLTKAEIKQIKELQQSRARQELGLFVTEGHKLSGDMLGAYPCRLLITTESNRYILQDKLRELAPQWQPQRIEVLPESFDFTRLSAQRSPQGVLAVFALPQDTALPALDEQGLILLLDDVQDPGNVGTIIRTADWFGIRSVLLTPACADPYSPKVLQASMGAMSRVGVYRLSDTESFLQKYQGEILGTFLGGTNLYSLPPKPHKSPRLLVLGNEGQGISPKIERYVSERITIPAYTPSTTGTESLNVAVAAAICISELRQKEQ